MALLTGRLLPSRYKSTHDKVTAVSSFRVKAVRLCAGEVPELRQTWGRMKSRRTKTLAASVLLATIITAWFFSFSFSNGTPNMTTGAGINGVKLPIMTMSMSFSSLDPESVSSFILIWILGMMAMMFPAMIPIVLIYNGLSARTAPGRSLVRVLSTPLFLGGYLLLYVMLGVVAFTGTYLSFYLITLAPSLSVYALPAAAGILFATGLWQLTPLKDRCLSHCVSPFGFFFMHAKKGLTGAFRMGAEHGYYCVGCCYFYMLVMLGVAAMSIPSMILLTALIAVEKLVARGARWFKWASATIFTGLGMGLLLVPQLFGLA